MISGIKSLVKLVTSLFNLAIDLVKGIGDLAYNLFKLPDLFNTIFSNHLIPSVVTTAVVACLAIMITLRIIGKEG